MNHLVLKRFCAIFLIVLTTAIECTDFNYDSPETWSRRFRQCRGLRQSPIDITNVVVDELNTLEFKSYDEAFNGTLEIVNNGHSIEFEVPATVGGSQPYITGGPLQRRFTVQSVHFHWGRRIGSEHRINGRPSDLEMHIVHQNGRKELAVIAVLFNITKNSNPALDEIFANLEKVIQYKSRARIPSLTLLNSILGDINTQNYYTYAGSLTTPPCTENVTWIVMAESLGIDASMVRKFLDIKDHRNIGGDTIRPLQRINARKVLRSFK